MKPGSDTKVDFEYERCGVANIFIASELLKGKRHEEVPVKNKNRLGNIHKKNSRRVV